LRRTNRKSFPDHHTRTRWSCSQPFDVRREADPWDNGCAWSLGETESDEVARAGHRPIEYATTNCRGVRDNTQKKRANRVSGELVVRRFRAYHKTSLCIQSLVDEHENEHVNDPVLLAACIAKKRAAATNKKLAKANAAWRAAIKAGECAAYPEDLKCLQKLLKCCKERKKQKDKKTGLFCCLCSDVEQAIVSIEAAQKARGCLKEAKK
jgi:hypothetical protein